MNKHDWFPITFFVICLCCLCGLWLCSCAQPADEYLRLHIRANGNSDAEQQVKLQVRDAVVAYLTPMAAKVQTKAEMQQLLAAHLDDVCKVADDVLRQNGCPYTSDAYLGNESFPQKTYGDLTLPQGNYDALVVRLGSGEGDNWWCVAFPPLCFVAVEDTGDDGIRFRSAIAEWFRQNVR